MPTIRHDIISIGTLSRNRLWNENQSLRTAHATTTLIRDGKRTLLVDPGLPAPALGARLHERTGLRPDQIDTVFLTNFRPAHRMGLALFDRATILISPAEQEAARADLRQLLAQAPEEDLDRQHLLRELQLLERMKPAEDSLVENVDLFPLPGYTAGTCGLLLSMPTATIIIAGDAVATLDHFLAAQVLPDAADIALAGESLKEVYEIADLVIPGHDNIFVNPRSFGM